MNINKYKYMLNTHFHMDGKIVRKKFAIILKAGF